MPTLYLMRHGIADNISPDIKRNLSSIGEEQVRSLAALLLARKTKIDHVIYSSAERAKQTASLMCDGLQITTENQSEDARIYNASVPELQAVISEINTNLESVLLVGHNPGLADLVIHLSDESVHLSAGNIAILQGASWEDIRACKCQLVGKL